MTNPMLSIAARFALGAIYSLALVLCRLTGRRRQMPAGLPRCVAVTGAFYNPGWFRAHMIPLLRSGINEVIVVTDRPLQALPHVRFACPPRWLTGVSGRALAKFLWLLLVGVRRRPDLFVGYHIFPGAIGALLAGRLFRRPACYQMTGGPLELLGGGWRAENPLMARLLRPSPLLQRLAITLIRHFDLVVVRGSKAQAFLADHGIRESVAVITGSIPQLAPAEHVGPHYHLVFVGRLTEIKRPQIFLELVARVKQHFPSLRSAVVGTGPLLSALRRRSRELNISDSVDFCGQQSDVSKIVGRSRVFVLTSRSEGFSIAMAEAMGAGVVPVVADVGELSDLIVSGDNGYLVAADDLDQYVERILLLLRDPTLFERLSTRAAGTARSRAAVDVIAAHWAHHLVELARRSGRSYRAPVPEKPQPTILGPSGSGRDRRSA